MDTRMFKWRRHSSEFVDNTELIKVFFGSGKSFKPQKLFVSAPSLFCKSSNMHMIRDFYRIKPDARVEENYKERHMFRTFEGLKILEEAHAANLQNHFCAHPVLHLVLGHTSIISYNCAVDACFSAMQRVYAKLYEPLKENLDVRNKTICLMWCKAVKWQDVGINHVERGLENLCDILFDGYKKRVLVLVDECDLVVRSALRKVREGEEAIVKQIAMLMEAIYSNVTKCDIDDHLQGVLLTGISYLSGVGFSSSIKVTPCRFPLYESDPECENQDIRDVVVRSYGLHEKHLHGLVTNSQQEGTLSRSVEEETEFIERMFGGYRSQKEDTEENHANMSLINECYSKAFADADVRRLILSLIRKQEISIDYIKKVEVTDLWRLRNGIQGSRVSRNVLFSLLMEVGFLTNVKPCALSSPGLLKVILPNEETRKCLQTKFIGRQVPIGQFDVLYVKECAKIVDWLRGTCPLKFDTLYKTYLKSLHKNLEDLFKGFASYKKQDLNERHLQSLMSYALTYTKESDLFPKYMAKDKGRADLWLKCIDPEFVIVFELKVNEKNLKDRCSLYALKQMTGEEGQSRTDYRTELSGKKFLLIGLTVDSNLAPSMCVETSKSKKAKRIFVSKTERALPCFDAGYYNGCYDLFKEEIVAQNRPVSMS